MSDRGSARDRWWPRRRGPGIVGGKAAEVPAAGFGDVGSMLSDPRAGPLRPDSAWLGEGLLLVGPDPTGQVAKTVADLPTEPGTVTVVSLLPDAAESWGWLVDVVAEAVPPGGAVRIVASRAAAVLGGEIPARRLAQRLRIRATAPDGEVVVAPGGATFVAADEHATGNWVTFTSDSPPERLGARHPVPGWASAADLLMTTGGTETLLVTGIPAGVWVRSTGADGGPDDLPSLVPADPGLCTVVIGSPGGPQPTPDEVCDLLAVLCGDDRAVLLVGYGFAPDATLSTAAALALRWDRPVTVANGTPVVDEHGESRTAVLDTDAVPLWWPANRRLAVPGQGVPVPVDPAPPVSGLARVSGATFAVRDGWLAEVTHFGLWVRHEQSQADRAALARIPWDPRWHSILAGVPGEVADGLRPALAYLVARIEPSTRRRTRIIPADLLADEGGPAGAPANHPGSEPLVPPDEPATVR